MSPECLAAKIDIFWRKIIDYAIKWQKTKPERGMVLAIKYTVPEIPYAANAAKAAKTG